MKDNKPSKGRRLETIEGIAAKADFLKGPLVSALANCLSSEDLTEGILRSPRELFLLHRAMLRALARNSNKLEQVRGRALNSLILELGNANYRQARRVANIVSGLCQSEMAIEDRRRVVHALLNSKFSQVRAVGYKIVDAAFSDVIIQEYLMTTWKNYRDAACAKVLVQSASSEFLVEELNRLESVLTEFLPKARLYIRAATIDPILLDRLKETDEIAWVYVKVKLGRPPLSTVEALDLFWRNETHPELALLLWCFGQMGLWDVLVDIASREEYFISPEYLEKKYLGLTNPDTGETHYEAEH